MTIALAHLASARAHPKFPGGRLCGDESKRDPLALGLFRYVLRFY
jgi:hypothetical protein